MGGLRELFEERVLDWPGVVKRPMFGTPGYTVGGKVFASLMEDSVTLKLPTGAYARFEKALKAGPFLYKMSDGDERRMNGWLRVPYTDEGDLDAILPAVKVAYESLRDGGDAPAKPAKKAKATKPAKATKTSKKATAKRAKR